MEKRLFAAAVCGKARISLAGALQSRFVIALVIVLAAGAALQFAIDEMFQSAYAEQSIIAGAADASQIQAPTGNSYHRSASESMSVVASHGSGPSSPQSYHRAMTESMVVTTSQGKAPNSYTRSMSEQASVTTGMPSSAPPAIQPARAATAPYSASSNQRIEERSNLTFKMLGKKGDMAKNVIGGTSLDLESFAPMLSDLQDQSSEIDQASDQDTPDDNSAFLDAISEYKLMQKSTENAAAINLSTSAVFLIGTVTVVITKLPFVSSGHVQGKIYAFLLKPKKVSNEKAGNQKTPAHVLLLLLVGFVSVSIVNAVEPISAQAFGDQSAGIAYKTGTTGGLAYREWDPSATSWGSQVSLTSAGAEIAAVKFLYSPTSQFRVIGVLETNGEIDIYYCESVCTSAGNWVGPTLVADMGTPTAPRKYFDIAFESSSGDLLVVYDKTTTDTNDFFYQTFDYETLSLSGESGFDYVSDITTDNDIRFFKMASKPGSDEIAMILLDATRSDTFALVWDGSSFGNQLTVTTGAGAAAIAAESIGVVYETSSGAAVVFSSDNTGAADLKGAFARWTGSWAGPTRYDINPAVSGTTLPVWSTVKANPDASSNQVMACNVDSTNLDLSCILVTAGTAGSNSQIDGAIGATSTRMFDFAWDPSSNNGIVLFEDATGATSIKFRTWDGSSWAAEQTITLANNAARWLIAASDTANDTTGRDSLWGYYEDAATDDIGEGEWERTSTTATFTDNGDTTITADAGATITHEAVAIAFRKTVVIPRTISESLAVTETLGRTVVQSVSLSEQLGVTESNARSVSLSRSVLDQFSVSEAISIEATIPMNEQLALTEMIATNIVFSRSMSEQMAATDGITVSASLTKSLSEQVGITEDIQRSMIYARALDEQLTTTETIGKVISTSISEMLGLTETASRIVLYSVSLADQLGITDMTSKTVLFSIQLPEQMGVTDDLQRSILANMPLSDQLGFTDNVTKVLSATITLTEQWALTDAIGSSVITIRTISDSLAVTDSVTGSPSISILIIDAMSIQDQFTDISATFSITLTQSIVLAQGFVTDYSGVFDQVENDGIDIGDSIVLSFGSIISMPESMGLQDQITILLTPAEMEDDDPSRAAISGSSSRITHVRSLVESMLITAATIASGEVKTIDIAESLELTTSQPLPQKVITLQNVTVAVNVADVQPVTFGGAGAMLNLEISNKNEEEENLVLRYTYSDPATGKLLHEGEQTITAVAGDSITQSVQIPFYSVGTYDLMIVVQSSDGTLAATDIVVSVPWLSVYLYMLVAVAGVVIAASACYVFFAMRRSMLS
jgi:hypothetical protein